MIFNSIDLCQSGRRRYQHEEETPEWFTEGPTSQADTIELRGFERRGEKARKKQQQEEGEEAALETEEGGGVEAPHHPLVNEAGDAQNSHGQLMLFKGLKDK